MASRQRRRQRGFTLLETFVALVILGFALAGLAMLMIGNVETGREARRMTAAGALAQKKLEDLRAVGYASAASSGTAESLAETGATTGVTLFSRTWTVANGATAGTKDLTVAVAWTDNLGSHQVQLQSKVAQ
jgi:prepilin-type N-terminal cleavage/methylation domain-containing protein